MKPLLTILLIAVSCFAYGQKTKKVTKKDTSALSISTVTSGTFDYIGGANGKVGYSDNGFSPVQYFRRDTIPVMIMLVDTCYTTSVVFRESQEQKESDSLGFNIRIVTPADKQYEAIAVGHIYPIVIFGYEVIEASIWASNAAQYNYLPAYFGNAEKKTYLNHLKQPLPERLIVWMAVRRKEK